MSQDANKQTETPLAEWQPTLPTCHLQYPVNEPSALLVDPSGYSNPLLRTLPASENEPSK